MGVHCEINLHKPPNGAFFGIKDSIISGIIKYVIEEEIAITKLIISLKGSGRLHAKENQTGSKKGNPRKYCNSETCIDLDQVVQSKDDGQEEFIIPVGSYEVPFSFKIPKNLPPTLVYHKYSHSCNVRCHILYYIRVKFSRPGLMKPAKRFRKEITIISGIIPRLPMTPVIHGGQKKLTQLFAKKPSIINVKANILNSVLKCCEKVQLHYEVINDTNVVVKAVQIRVIETHSFFARNSREITIHEVLLETDTKTVSIQSGGTQEMAMEISLPSYKESAEFSTIYARNYTVDLVVHLPIPHRNYALQIPIQIGNNIEEDINSGAELRDAPPSYWEVMNEDKNDTDDLDHLDNVDDTRNGN